MTKMIKRVVPIDDIPAFFAKQHKIDGEVASKFYNDMSKPVQFIQGPVGSAKTFAVQMKIIRMACEQPPIPRSEKLMVGIGKDRKEIPERMLTSYFKVKVVAETEKDLEHTIYPSLLKMLGGYGSIKKSSYKKPFVAHFANPLFEDTIVELEITFDIMSGIDLGSEKGKEYSLVWVSECCFDDTEAGYEQLGELGSRIRGIPDKAMIHSDFKENEEFQYSVDYVKHRKVKILIDMNTPFESWKSWILGLSPIPRTIDKLYKDAIESARDSWGVFIQKPAWYFNSKLGKFTENTDSENRKNLPDDYYSIVGLHPNKIKKDFCCIPVRTLRGDKVFHNFQVGHIDSDIVFPEKSQLFIGIDYGFHANGAVFGFIQAGIVKIINEYRGTNETTQEFLDNVFIISKSLNPSEVIVIDDPTSATSMGIGKQAENSNRELAEQRFDIVFGAATNDWSPRINAVNNILTRLNSKGFLQLSIHPQCFNIIEGLEGEYIYGKDGKPDKTCKTSDVMDALQYIIMRLGSDVSSSINEYVNKVPTLAEKFKRLDNLHSSNERNRKNFTNNDGLL